MCFAAGAGAAACACACSIRDMERVTGLFTCVDSDSARSRRRARAWRAAREAGFACFVSGGGGGDSEEKTDHIVGRLRPGERSGRSRGGRAPSQSPKRLVKRVQVQSSVSGSANSVTAQRPLRLVAQQRGAAVSTSRKLGALADAIFRRKRTERSDRPPFTLSSTAWQPSPRNPPSTSSPTSPRSERSARKPPPLCRSFR